MWVGRRAGQNRKDMPSYAEILLLRNLGNHTKPLTDAKEVPLNMKGKNGGYRERAFNLVINCQILLCLMSLIKAKLGSK